MNDNAAFDLAGSYSIDLSQNVTNKLVRANGAGGNVTFNLNGFTYTSDQFTGGGLDTDDLSVTMTGSPAPAVSRVRSGSTAEASPPPTGTGGQYQPALLSVRKGLRYAIRGGVLVQALITNIDGDTGTELSISGVASSLDTAVLSIGLSADQQGTLLISEGATLNASISATLGVAAGGLFSDPATGTVAVSGVGIWAIEDTSQSERAEAGAFPSRREVLWLHQNSQLLEEMPARMEPSR
ncbi:MAG: hypothetical protein H0T83_09810 [Chthoniobacterales bacterium]|nr:hypothetical protein [Chthoniobacterales bacterium]